MTRGIGPSFRNFHRSGATYKKAHQATLKSAASSMRRKVKVKPEDAALNPNDLKGAVALHRKYLSKSGVDAKTFTHYMLRQFGGVK